MEIPRSGRGGHRPNARARGPGNRLRPTPWTRGSRLGSFLRNDRLHRLEGPQRRRDFLTRGEGPSQNVPLPGRQAPGQAGASPLLASFPPRLPSSCVTRPASPAPVPRAISPPAPTCSSASAPGSGPSTRSRGGARQAPGALRDHLPPKVDFHRASYGLLGATRVRVIRFWSFSRFPEI